MADLKISQLTGASTPLAGTEVLPIVQSGSTVKVSVANLTAGRAVATAGGSFTDNITQSTAAKGINFTANTPAAGMTSELLNWYEEGTWTPAYSASGLSGVTYGSPTLGRYTRTGNQVTVWFFIYTNGTFTATSGDVTITGLPFTSNSTSGVNSGLTFNYLSRFTNPPVAGRIVNSSTSIILYKSFNASGVGNDPIALTAADLISTDSGNNNWISGTATYMV
jgi:hypothetical protein